MAKKLGPIEVVCNSPPYTIVEACVACGEELHRPCDTRWESLVIEDENGKRKIRGNCLVCQRPILPAKGWKFTYSSGDEVTMFLTQCDTCATIYWREK